MPEVSAGSAASPNRQFRNLALSQLLSYRLPIAGIVSILHRISGALLFLVGIPILLYLLQQSITSEISFESYRAAVSGPLAKLVLLGICWAYIHHLCAGVRYLLLDVHMGIGKEQSRTSAIVVMVVSVVLTLVVALKLFGVF